MSDAGTVDQTMVDPDESVTDTEIAYVLSDDLTPEFARNVIRRLNNEREELQAELEEVKEDRDSYIAVAEYAESESFSVLRAVRDWFDETILLNKPVRDPRRIWRMVDRVLQ